MKEALIVAAVAFGLWLVQGMLGPPDSGGSQPRLRKSPLRFRFSLRELFLAITVIAILIGLMAALLPSVR
jgi:hypothetical protein